MEQRHVVGSKRLDTPKENPGLMGRGQSRQSTRAGRARAGQAVKDSYENRQVTAL